jgi:hypothetical protein
MLSQTIFVASNLCALLVAFLLACSLPPPAERLQRAVAFLTAYPLVISLTLLSLGTIKLLRPEFALLCALVLGLMAVLLFGRRWNQWFSPTLAILPAGNPDSPDQVQQALESISVAILGGFAGCYLASLLSFGTHFSNDDINYHAVAAARWIRDGSFTIPRCIMHGYFPYNTELLALWFQLPSGLDAWVGATGVFWALLIAVCSASLCRLSGNSNSTAILLAALTICSPRIYWLVRMYTSTDLSGAAMLLCGAYFCCSSLLSTARQNRLAFAVFCGLAVGWAVGAKVSFVPAAAVLALFLLVQCWLWYGRTEACYVATVFAASLMTTGSYWYIRNWMLTGNPLYPTEVGPFAGPFSKLQQMNVTLAYHLFGGSIGQDPSEIAEIIRRRDNYGWSTVRPPHSLAYFKMGIGRYLDWPVGLCLISILGYVLNVASEFRRSNHNEQRERVVNRLLWLVGVILVIAHPFMPWSFVDENGVFSPSPRYLSAPYLIGVVLFSIRIRAHSAARWFWLGISMIAVVACWPASSSFHHQIAALVGAAAGLGLLQLSRKRLNPLPASILGAICVTLLFVGMAAIQEWQQRLTDRGIANFYTNTGIADVSGGLDRPIGKAWAALEMLPAGSRITCFWNWDWGFYPLFGRRLQFDFIEVLSDGRRCPLLHQRTERASLWHSGFTERPVGSLVPNLQEAGVDYVLVSKWVGPEWPVQRSQLSESADASTVFADGYSEIWKVEPGRGRPQ